MKTGRKQGLIDLMGRLSLLTSLDQDKEPDQEVRLMTLHGSKGLEFPHVFMAGVEEELLPHRNSLEENGEQEERQVDVRGHHTGARVLDAQLCQEAPPLW